MPEIYFIRHAEGEHNVNQKYHLFNPALTKKGYNQILKTKIELINIDFNEIYVSPLLRTLQTAKGIFGEKKMIAVEEIREFVDNQCDLRQPISQSAVMFPFVNFNNIIYNTDKFKNKTFYIKESLDDLNLRQHKMFNTFRSLSGKIAVVTHGAFIEKYMKKYHNQNIWLENCDYIVVNY